MTTAKSQRTVFFVSDRTGITAELLGKTLLTQFPGIEFLKRTFPFVDSVDKAKSVLAKIHDTAQKEDRPPIVFSTLINEEVRAALASDRALIIDLFADFIRRLETELGQESTHALGLSHGIGDELVYQKRMDALNYTLSHDDGMHTANYDRADVILVGVSRTGKTPTCLYLAMQYGICAANYPLTPDDFNELALPKPLQPQRAKLHGLTIQPERLAKIRHERKPESRYASLENCQGEIRAAEALLRQAHIPILDTSSMSIEEIAISILYGTGLIKRVKT
ncbi:PEP synthetase regulatory protein [Sulfuricaulis limicola]|uniref:Putative phosphoenolpyruvate synthase regulatory protein n=1 Tax=Sulfuricaulis limicola TaxID=1620215 RepID=A0A1B4XF86_9GAMM|nr:pyruvate, water dikinase regulatory protein [Sulfuricaulis limicola]BAV33461.1 PEP synthetase regulatory protein [Sulfuricaulis limicola]